MNRIVYFMLTIGTAFVLACDAGAHSDPLGPAAAAAAAPAMASATPGMDSGASGSASVPPAGGATGQAAGERAPVHRVTGHAVLDFSAYPGGGRERYEFAASMDAAGGVRGHIQITYLYDLYSTETFSFRGDVACLAVEGGDAWIGFRVTRTEDPAEMPVGAEAVIRVRDVGEGSHMGAPESFDDPRDGIGDLVTDVPAAVCAQKPTASSFWYLNFIDQGNVQVR